MMGCLLVVAIQFWMKTSRLVWRYFVLSRLRGGDEHDRLDLRPVCLRRCECLRCYVVIHRRALLVLDHLDRHVLPCGLLRAI